MFVAQNMIVVAGMAIMVAAGCAVDRQCTRIRAGSHGFEEAIDGIPVSRDDSLPGEYQVWRRIPPSEVGTFPAERQVLVTRFGEIDRTIRVLADFRGLVRVRNEAEALSFVRLLTDGRTAHAGLDEWLGCEILENGELLHLAGRIPASVLTAAGWRAAVVSLHGRDYRITRYVLLETPPARPKRIVRAREVLSADGKYTRVETIEVFVGAIDGVVWPARL